MTIRDDRTSEPETGGARRRAILEIAARLFARKGYRGTSMRDIGEAAGVQGGSLYHHIRSKDALFVELHHAALDEAERRIAQAASQQLEPWARLEAACAALLEIQLDPDSLTMPMMNDFREVPATVRTALIERRDRFETRFRDLVANLPLPPELDRSIYRNLLLSQLNSAADWVRPGRLSPRDIAEQIARVFRHDISTG
ncbi:MULTISPECIES: TetR/AcrR family transcriptional regulator [Sphingobium]|jgi:TetR/AcrR family transcriptional regulator, cholesterol catabolism regulator|uniref:TetR/AcrR family transcriptional regulator n=1 Tax=Sphingobium TaxID=165695 RepID=UPI000C6926C8|nr:MULTISPECIES: TetR/AcrR family transcriptional regulator [Sphingobium]MBA37956.1 TetR family transcriptional regulator [Sphingobium sp.]MEC9018357.1 TetR/AcrR family transcriptional regulator [Pseudomonadota bacterium]MBS50547.1 TetR family transcriptional regulator [Sphingobium sp.]MCC4258115.1 TetR/AcrR family transcriptional regulator [Sphingobium lactosutens]HCW60203.1 TetR family transcriptional regulator [Sphingobium sp.]|tara:strand:+ start:5689 stop:6285 length:597 start_codon:yes stop_codon:yes gene_type:complete